MCLSIIPKPVDKNVFDLMPLYVCQRIATGIEVLLRCYNFALVIGSHPFVGIYYFVKMFLVPKLLQRNTNILIVTELNRRMVSFVDTICFVWRIL